MFTESVSPKSHSQLRPSSTDASPEQIIGTEKREWTKFPESPTSSSLSSPGPKPVNFDIQKTTQAIVSDPQILHPVALRVTPEVLEEEKCRRKITDTGVVYDENVTLREFNNNSPGKIQGTPAATADLRPIQRPQPKKVSSKGSIPPPPQREPSLTHSDNVDGLSCFSNSKKDPPPPPPRLQRGHHRSSSLDLKKLKMGGQTSQGQPQLQPMTSYDGYECVEPSTFADFAQFPRAIEV